MNKAELKKYMKDKKPIGKAMPGENILGGSYKDINPIRKLGKKKTFLQKLFS